MSAADSSGASGLTTTALDGPSPMRRRIQRLRWPIMIGVAALAVLIGLAVYFSGGRYQSTDDAEVKGASVMVSSTIAGRVVAVNVREGQFVHAGDVLFQLDGRAYQAAYQEAQANLAAARAQIEGLKATYHQRQADLQAAEDSAAYLEGEAKRQKALVAAGSATEAQAAEAQNAAVQAQVKIAGVRDQLAAALAALGGHPDGPVDAQPAVMQNRAQLDRAGLNKSYIEVDASQDGIVTKVNQLQVGDYINAATPVFSLVSNHLWIEANFKENQLEYMRAGQSAKVKIDAYPDRVFEARVDSLSPGTGSSFSVLPAENATGNWVKVTQRVPVTLTLTEKVDAPLRPGLSASVKVDTEHHRRLFGSPKTAARP